MNNLYNVMTKQTKGKLVNFRVREDLKRDFEIVAELRGTSLSGLIHQLLVKAVREEKEREPSAFVITKKQSPEMIQIPDKGELMDEKPVKKKKVA